MCKFKKNRIIIDTLIKIYKIRLDLDKIIAWSQCLQFKPNSTSRFLEERNNPINSACIKSVSYHAPTWPMPRWTLRKKSASRTVTPNSETSPSSPRKSAFPSNDYYTQIHQLSHLVYCFLFTLINIANLIPIIKVNKVSFSFITPFDSPTLITVSLCLGSFLPPSWSPPQSRSLGPLWLRTYLPLCIRFSSQRRWITRKSLTGPRNRRHLLL